MFKKFTTIFFGVPVLSFLAWFGTEAYSFTKEKFKKIDHNSQRIIINESNYGHIRETLERLESGQIEMRSYIIKNQ